MLVFAFVIALAEPPADTSRSRDDIRAALGLDRTPAVVDLEAPPPPAAPEPPETRPAAPVLRKPSVPATDARLPTAARDTKKP
ncbi:MAG: hypothetical protein EP330_22255 [Deltaproteobacteria bacterium]|nr:MAG: hypothetical protein EP330_22255 [Deltaproteobacteria bacterium]